MRETLADYKLLTVPEVARRFGRHPSTVLNWIGDALLRAIPVESTHGKRPGYVVPESALVGFEPPPRGANAHRRRRRKRALMK